MTILDSHGNDVPMLENLYDPREEMRKIMEGGERKYAKESEFAGHGFMTQKFSSDGQLVNEEGGNDNE